MTTSPLAWRAWAQSVRDFRPAWAAAQTDASTDVRDASDSRNSTADIGTAISAAARLRDLDIVLQLCASAIRGIPLNSIIGKMQKIACCIFSHEGKLSGLQ